MRFKVGDIVSTYQEDGKLYVIDKIIGVNKHTKYYTTKILYSRHYNEKDLDSYINEYDDEMKENRVKKSTKLEKLLFVDINEV